MIERGEMKLDDPVAKYLPGSVKMPTRNGKEITLRHLATYVSGLPSVPDNLDAKRADNPYADYTVEKIYAFLSGYRLTRDPGEKSEYSNFGMGLLGHVIALKAGAGYEALVLDRICRPLKMDSTRITLTADLKSRFATGHNRFGEPVPSWDLPALSGALRSTAKDMLKYVSANLGLTPSSLTPRMKITHDMGLAWSVTTDRDGTTIISHGGGTGGCRTFPAFDKARQRGVVVLTNSNGIIDVGDLANFLLKCEWQSHRRPTATRISSEVYDAYVGQYQQTPGVASRVGAMRQFFLTVPKAAIYALAVCGLAILGVCVWRVGSFRKRVLIFGSAVLLTGVAATVITLEACQTGGMTPEAGIDIRREGDRLFAEVNGIRSWPVDLLFPIGPRDYCWLLRMKAVCNLPLPPNKPKDSQFLTRMNRAGNGVTRNNSGARRWHRPGRLRWVEVRQRAVAVVPSWKGTPLRTSLRCHSRSRWQRSEPPRMNRVTRRRKCSNTSSRWSIDDPIHRRLGEEDRIVEVLRVRRI